MARSVPLSRSTLRVGGGSAFFVRPHDTFMIIDKLATAGVGISFIGIGITMRKQQNKQWRAYFFGGIVLMVLVVIALIFGLSM